VVDIIVVINGAMSILIGMTLAANLKCKGE